MCAEIRRGVGKMEFHEVANIFPMMSAEEFNALKSDIQENGLLEPIWIFENKIIDGRNRYQACIETDTKPEFREWSGNGSLVAFVVSLNLHRRHLSESQRGMVAAKLATMQRGQFFGNQQVSANLQTPTRAEAAEMLSVSERTVNAAAKVKDEGTPELVAAVESGRASVSAAAEVATLPKAEQQEIVAKGETEILKAAKKIKADRAEKRREERINKVVELSKKSLVPLATIGRFPVLYVDPPWRYDFAADDADVIENHYPTMTLDEICALPVSDVALEDCVLFLWTTSPKLEESFRVLNAWGFTYRTCAVWDKQWIGPGYYFRQRHELLLVATKGTLPVPSPSNRPDSVFTEKRTAHSRKPEVAYRLIESMYPELPKLELFSRESREGWDSWGNEAMRGVA